MTLSEKIRATATPGDLFPELTKIQKKTDRILANIAVAVREKRKSMGMTQKEFAKFLGVSQGMVSKYESAEYNFSIESVIELYDKLDMPFILKEKTKKIPFCEYKEHSGIWKSVSLKPNEQKQKELSA